MKVYLNEQIHPEAVEYLRQNVTLVDSFDDLESIDGIYVRGIKVGKDIIENAPNLKVIGRHGVGYETVDVECARAHGVHVVNAPRSNAVSVAELIVGRFLEMSRDLYRANTMLREGKINRIAPPELKGIEVSGKNLGLIGMGNIPTITANMMKAAFGVKVYGYDPFVTKAQAEEKGCVKIDTIEELLEISDLVTVNVHLTDETRNLISGNMFDHFRKNAIFVNTARGGIVNEEDLYEALTEGKLRAAAFDVFADEPIKPDNKLLTLENFSATPHIGGNTEEAFRRTGLKVAQNVVDILMGREVTEGLVV